MEPETARAHLEQERARLEAVRASFDIDHLSDETETESLGELSGVDQHQADIGTETFEREKDISILEQVAAELHDVELALRRLDDGTYGRCEACGKPIDDARLDARPAARLCVADQQAAERDVRR
jgi:DnaK suppressor protein